MKENYQTSFPRKVWETTYTQDKKQNRLARIVTLSVGTRHYQNGNPGVEKNFERLYGFALESLKDHPNLIVFPEFSTSGWPYTYDHRGELLMKSSAEAVPGDGTYYNFYVNLAKSGNCFVSGWLIEKEKESNYYNTAFIIDPKGNYLGKYRKVHPSFGEEFVYGVKTGAEFPVFDLGFAKVGIQICWDMDFPEGCRILMLKGADFVIHPTVANDRRNICPVRCFENGLSMVISVYMWGSYAVDERGYVIADLWAKKVEGGYLISDLYPSKMDEKYAIYQYGREVIRSRRNPAAYGLLVDQSTHLKIEEVCRDKNGNLLSHEKIKKHFPYM